jgi:hypothetical protein
VEHLLVQGVSTNREVNDYNYDYELKKSRDEQGRRLYCHKYFSGHMHYYQHLAFQKQRDRVVELEKIVHQKDLEKL